MGDLVYSVSVWVIPLVFAIVFHEISHGWVANLLGDPTAAQLGRLSPNPIRHVDPFGTVVLPLVLAVSGAPVFGWAKPVPVIAQRLRNPRIDMMLVALAGPLSNLLMAVLATIALTFSGLESGVEPVGFHAFVVDNLVNFLLINIFLAVFNLLPIPPFDGGHVVEGLLPRPLAAKWAQMARYAFPVLIILLVVLPMLSPQLNVVGRLVQPIVFAIARFFLGSAGLAG
ncbi:site-2 protease family protein [Sphingomonas sp. AOB5]|uniref:site-2 protease family protein n=1 Tax=Sphingomonas sp. AOB5 TaxID=3034017 RepID=UPI0023F77F42|nr:site-2 protease family protein [Sphingomonas sp. AOB5]MDF7777602.1 site-2 protease family protein [Sphingomonas sp. AOB5]